MTIEPGVHHRFIVVAPALLKEVYEGEATSVEHDIIRKAPGGDGDYNP